MSRHTITEVARARMVDWMFEVIYAFKMSEQTFFLSVQYMDRFIGQSTRTLKIEELHLIGITCMFIASKYEDITPLYLKTMVKKVSHGKIKGEQIMKLEREIVSTLKFKLASVPTVLEFLESYLTHDIFKDHRDAKLLMDVCKYLAYLQTHHIQFCDQDGSVIAAACINAALNLIQTMRNSLVKPLS